MKKFRTLGIGIIIAILILTFSIKVDTKIYIGDYSYESTVIDLTAYIDNDLLFEDSLYSSPFRPRMITNKLRYGFHEIELISNKADIRQKSKAFLLPNQHIYIEFLGADTFCRPRKEVLDIIDFEEDSLFREIRLNSKLFPEKSRFRVESLFNPFYTE